MAVGRVIVGREDDGGRVDVGDKEATEADGGEVYMINPEGRSTPRPRRATTSAASFGAVEVAVGSVIVGREDDGRRLDITDEEKMGEKYTQWTQGSSLLILMLPLLQWYLEQERWLLDLSLWVIGRMLEMKRG